MPQFEQASGHKVTTIFTGTLDANKRLAAGETYDLLIMSSASIDEQIKGGKVVPGSRVDLAKSGVAVAVRAGAPKPDISTTEALKKTLLAAKSIGYSTGPSGNYVIGMFQRMGIADEIKPKLKQTPSGVFVGQPHRQWRSRDRLSAGERADRRPRRRLCRSAAGGHPANDRFLQRHPGWGEGG